MLFTSTDGRCMKLALIILGLFFISLTVRSRELSVTERAALISLKKTTNLKKFFEAKINRDDLGISDYIAFSVLRRSCDPLNLMLKHIGNQDEDSEAIKDKAKALLVLMNGCEKGTISMSSLYIEQQEE